MEKTLSKRVIKISKEAARETLGIENKKTILLMMGSMGFGNILKNMEIIDDVDADFQVLCVCGNNEKMQREIKSKIWKKTVLVYGFVDNVDVMMDAADFIITNPPFNTLFRDFFSWVMESGKQFLFIASINSITYKYFNFTFGEIDKTLLMFCC